MKFKNCRLNSKIKNRGKFSVNVLGLEKDQNSLENPHLMWKAELNYCLRMKWIF